MTAVPSDTLRERAPARVRWHLPAWPDPWWPTAALGAVAVAGLVAFLAPLGGVDLSRLNGLGLISVLPVISLLGITAAVVAFCAGLCLPRAYPVLLGATLAGIVLCLNAVTVFTEPEPRFPTAYQIAGYAEYVSRTGHTAPGLEAYFSWPGFLSTVAFLERVSGDHDLIPVLRWWPVTVDMLCLVPLYLLMRNLRASWRAKWLAARSRSELDFPGHEHGERRPPPGHDAVTGLGFRPGCRGRPRAQAEPGQQDRDEHQVEQVVEGLR